MRLFSSLRIAVKLPLLMGAIAALTLILAEISAYQMLRDSVHSAARERLTAVAESGAAGLSDSITTIRSDLQAHVGSPATLAALRAFKQSWQRIPENPSTTIRDIFSGRGEEAAEPGPAKRLSYALVHRRFHHDFRAFRDSRGYEDIYLVDDAGNVVYSVAKGTDFAGSIFEKPIRGTGLASAAEAAVSTHGVASGVMSAFAPYALAGKGKSTFLAAPVLSPFGTFEGVLVYRVSDDHLTATLASEHASEAGHVHLMTAVGEIVGSNSIPAPHLPEDVLISENSGILESVQVGDESHMSAYVPLTLLGHRFIVVAHESMPAILAPMSDLVARMLRDGIATLIAVSVAGLLIARGITVPLGGVGLAMEEVARGEYGTLIPGAGRKDEIGHIARTLDKFRAHLVDAEALTRESAFKSAAFEGASASLILTDRSLTIIYVNRAMDGLIGEHEPVLSRFIPEVLQGPLVGRNLVVLHRGAATAAKRLASTAGLTVSQETSFGQCTLRFDTGLVTDGAGAVLGYVVEVTDVTEMRIRKALLDAVGRAHPVAEFSPDGRLVRANARFLDFVGLNKAGAPGLPWSRLVHWHDASGPSVSEPWPALKRGESASGRVRRANAPDGDQFDATLSPVIDGAGNLAGAVLLAVEPPMEGAAERGALAARTEKSSVRELGKTSQ